MVGTRINYTRSTSRERYRKAVEDVINSNTPDHAFVMFRTGVDECAKCRKSYKEHPKKEPVRQRRWSR